MTALNEKALEKAVAVIRGAWDFPLTVTPESVTAAAITTYLTALPQSPVGELATKLRAWADQTITDSAEYDALLRKAATALTALQAENERLKHAALTEIANLGQEIEAAESKAEGFVMVPVIEVRNNDDGSLDEVVMSLGGECIFHLEQMDHNRWWMGCYDTPRKGGLAIHLSAKGKITANVIDDRPAPSDKLVKVESMGKAK